MSTHYVVIESVTGQMTESAYLEVCNATGEDVTFTLRDANGSGIATFTVTPNSDHFASSGNIFSQAGNRSASVVVTCTTDTSVMLRHTVNLLTGSVTRSVNVPKSTEARANTVIFPTGNVGTRAHAMVFNPTGSSIQVSLRYGSPNNSPVSTTSVPSNGFAFVAITNESACAILTSASDFTAQYLVNLGGNPFTESYELP